MIFGNDMESPLFETDKASDSDTMQSLIIDQERQIRLVSMKVDSGRYYHGIRFSDFENKVIAEAIWYEGDWSEWTSLQEVPADQQIIGMIADSESSSELLNLSFLLGKTGRAEVSGEMHFPPMSVYPTLD